jgi:hypothetical protein
VNQTLVQREVTLKLIRQPAESTGFRSEDDARHPAAGRVDSVGRKRKKERLGKNWFAICSKMVFSTEAIVEMLLRSEIRLN